MTSIVDGVRRSPGIVIGVVVVAALATGLLIADLIGLGSPERSGWVHIGSEEEARREGVMFIPAIRAFVVADREGVPLTLFARSPHRGGRIAYCESSTWFEDVVHGSMFDHLGRYVLGPSPRGLDRLPTEIRDGEIWVNANHLVLGPPREGGGDERPHGPFCSGS